MTCLCTCGHRTDNWPEHKKHIDLCPALRSPRKYKFYNHKNDERFRRFKQS